MHKKSIRKLAQFHGWWVYQTFLRRTSQFSEEERRAWIHQQLKQTLVRAYEGTKYYSETFKSIGFDPRTDYQGPQTLQQLPLLTKDIIRERYEDLMDRRFSRMSALAETSGTTGRPLKMLLNEGCIALDYACMYQMWAQAGYRFRDPFLALRSYVPSSADQPLWMHDRAQNTLFMSAYHFSPQTAADYMKEIARFSPKFIRSYPSSLLVLAEYLERSGQRLPSVRGLFTASETLSSREREIIERVFGPILFDWYGMTEPTLVAFEGSEHDGLNIVWQYGHAEILADPVSDQGSSLVATSLQNPVMPFIRYDTGDRVTRHASETADNPYPLKLAHVHGRKDDVILTPDGRRLPSVNFYSVFRSVPGIVRFQIVQYGSSDIVVNIETADTSFQKREGYQQLRAELISRFGPSMMVECRFNQQFETNRDGKTPVVLRRMANKAVEERQEYVISSKAAWGRHRMGEDILKLDWNEADTLPSKSVRDRLSALIQDPCSLIWYPEPQSAALLEALAQRHAVKPENVLATHGSDMALGYLVQCYVRTGDRVMTVTPGYDNFRALVEQRGGQIVTFEHEGEGPFPLKALIERMRECMPRLLYLTNPNNPIGYHLNRAVIASIVEAAAHESCLVIVDEAYAEFAEEDCVPLISAHSNLVLVRTFSKAFGLAGLRMGHLIANEHLLESIKRVANPKHLTSFAQVAAITALEDWPSVQSHIQMIKDQRQRLISHFRKVGVKCHDSQGNYVLFFDSDVPSLIQWFEARGILLRERSQQLPHSVRVTVGSPESMDRFLQTFDLYLAQKSPV